MATFIELRTDSFADNVTRLKRDKLSFNGTRRPLRGIEIKEDTYSVMKVIKANGEEIPLVDAGGLNAQSGRVEMAGRGVVPSDGQSIGGARTFNYSNYIIQNVTDSRQEKQQIIETFGESYIFFFGERPRVLNVSGVLFNTLDFNWRTEFWWNYENTLRGTKLVEANARVYLHWDDIVVEGYILSAQALDDANSPYHVQFSFTMFVTNHTYLNQVGDDAYPIRHAVDVEPLQRSSTIAEINENFGNSHIAKELGIQNTIKLEAVGAVQPTTSTQAAFTALKNAGDPTPASKFNLAKNVVANAIALGVNAQNLTFLSLVSRFFNQRKMKFPRGLAGSESNTGPTQLSGIRQEVGPKRKIPLRSRIRDNVDEYIGYGGSDLADYADSIQASQAAIEKLPDENALEKYCQGILGEMRINAIQHGKPDETNIFSRGHNMVAASGESLTSGKVELATSLGFHL